ncbi:MAG: type III pantothenate kinase [Chloracidobacterium sp.]|nr:type III pantothenate kinase [Chloracidobacterium sp.]
MFLAVDIGNTSTKFGIFNGEHLTSKFSIPTDKECTASDLRSLIGSEQAISNAAVCSVVPERGTLLTNAIRDAFGIRTLSITNDLAFGLKINYQPLSTLGTDRLVNSFAAAEKYGMPCIVCSIGTATTFDVVSEMRELLGGMIAPGMKTMAKALHLYTAKLPEVEIKRPESVLGNTTVESIRSGVYYGHVAMIEGVIQKIKNEINGVPKVVATGGFASMVAENTSLIDIVDENLLLDGLRLFHERFNK